MNVLLVSEPGVDGVFRFVEALAHHLLKRGFRVHLAYSDRRGSDRLLALVASIESSGGETLNLKTGNAPSPSDLKAFLKLHAFVRKIRPDVIHSHSSKAGVLARALAILGIHTRQIYQPHAYSGMRPQSLVTRTLYNGIESFFGRWGLTLNCSDDENDFARSQLHLSEEKVAVIFNSVDTQKFRPATTGEKISLRREFGLPSDAIILGSLGRASEQKDPLTLYRAFAAAHRQEPRLVLFHLGTGELDDSLNDFIVGENLQHAIVRKPYLPTPNLFYRAVDGFILTSRYEGLSLAALEALASGLPMILSNAPGNQTLLRLPLSHRWSAEIEDVRGFERAILQWFAAMSMPGQGRPSNHRMIALDRFDSSRTIDQVLDLYRRICPEIEFGAEHSARPGLEPSSGALGTTA